MEIKVQILQSSLVIKSITQSSNSNDVEQLKIVYDDTIVQFDALVTSLLHGGEIDGGQIPPLSNREVIGLVKQLDLAHEKFQASASNLITLQQELIANNISVAEAMERLDRMGDLAANHLNKIEQMSATEMNHAHILAYSASEQAITILMITAVF
ncbi:MAG: hypothetical protein HRU22_12605 [Gammaproteobacteria bacterium]|nr:hypothetical protein [Gammaproteobacteria bacterium]